MKTRTAVAISLSLTSILAASSAAAEEVGGSVAVGAGTAAGGSSFGSAGKMVVGLERIFQLSMEKRHIETEYTAQNGTKTTFEGDESRTRFNAPGSGFTPYSLPMLSFHYFVAPSISVGGGISYFSGSSSDKTTVVNGGTSVSTESDGPSTSSFLLAPRVGYNIPVSPRANFWLRGGITYWTSKSETVDTNNQGMMTTTTTDTTKVSGLSVSLDPMLLLSPVEGVGFMIGPVIDFPLTGSGDRTVKTQAGSTTVEQKTDVKALKYTQIGAAAGLAFVF